MTLESDLRDLIRDAAKLAIRDELPSLLREHLKPLVERAAPGPDRGEALSTVIAARYANVSPATVRAWVASGQLRAQRAGRVLKVRRADLDAFLARSAPREEGVIDLSERARAILSGKKRAKE
jgi:excisionase family DNA binding protein